MRQTIEGIYLGHINYSETSVIARFYTKQFGMQSFILKGVRKKKSKFISLLQPLNLLEITSNYRGEKDLNLCFELTLVASNNSISSDIRKTTVAMFLAEVVYKAIQETESNLFLFSFLKKAIWDFENKNFTPYFHHLFLLELTLFLGFYPLLSTHESNNRFNYTEGTFEFSQADAKQLASTEGSFFLKEMLQNGASFFIEGQATANAHTRMILLNTLTRFYEVQLGLKRDAFKSHQVLQEVFG